MDGLRIRLHTSRFSISISIQSFVRLVDTASLFLTAMRVIFQPSFNSTAKNTRLLPSIYLLIYLISFSYLMLVALALLKGRTDCRSRILSAFVLTILRNSSSSQYSKKRLKSLLPSKISAADSELRA
jgi:hypothetical protein